MADTSFVICGTGAQGEDFGTGSWTNPNNITSDNTTSYARTESILNTERTNTKYLIASNFGFNVPDGNIVTNVEVQVVGRTVQIEGSSSSNFEDDFADLMIGGVVIKPLTKHQEVVWPRSNTTKYYGIPSDVIELGLTNIQVNNPNFGFGLSLTSQDKSQEFRAFNIKMKISFERSSNAYLKEGGVWKLYEARVRDEAIWKPSENYINDGGIWKK